MSPRSSKPAKKAKPKGPPPDPDIYVGLLFVSVASLLTGCIFLIMELNNYQWTMPTG
jgi:hypothetical protein